MGNESWSRVSWEEGGGGKFNWLLHPQCALPISSTESFSEEFWVGGIRNKFIFYLMMLYNYTLH